ncbi:hypothetical protein BCU70_13260 [Vibrio sp. 10N.286.49.C2]|uniref:hypothetical protein n=1 Tax=unclassified Vibrio TaxID=2614977 RepID=UPI000C83123A|nr:MULTISPECIES: hypothetical protein [unclassified Vibrio]PMH39345.1 hypothetical protein BCU70_13260 [Vibrio sp. 10N.286.49.C2]PMH54305.1 hypothetical protein BCU66_11695 [Vibrio sp. 10N.286.49.B1]PMH79444.1 hypothetical protein BCU58_05255 [Vibrio sp. 10N.286.48.B7]
MKTRSTIGLMLTVILFSTVTHSANHNYQNQATVILEESILGTVVVDQINDTGVIEPNIATIKQTGIKNKAYVIQHGSNNTSDISQHGTVNIAATTQLGSDKTATIVQDGSYNAAFIVQTGTDESDIELTQNDCGNIAYVKNTAQVENTLSFTQNGGELLIIKNGLSANISLTQGK